MKEDLTTLLQTIPFAPFTVNTRDGKAYDVKRVGQMCVGDAVCAYVDAQGFLLAIPFDNIDRVVVADPEAPGQEQFSVDHRARRCGARRFS